MVLRLRRIEPAELTRARRLLARGAREHAMFGGMLVLAVVVRAGVAIAQRPAIFFSDSWVYASLAYEPGHVGIAPERPPGYSLLLAALALPGRSLAAVTLLQHAAGLATGVLTYRLLTGRDVRRWLAAPAAGVVVLDGYAIALEQHVMPEAAFTLALVASAYLLVRGEGRGALALSGLLLGAAVLLRTAAVFALPAWIAYAAARRLPRRASGLAIVCALVPVLGLVGYYGHRYGRLGLSGADGWFLYARVGTIASCEGVDVEPAARPLCSRPGAPRLPDPVSYLFAPASPALRLFGGMTTDPARQHRSNRILSRFAVGVIAARPGAYARLVVRDFGRFFTPGRGPGESESPISLPAVPRRTPPYFIERARDDLFPSYAPATHAPNGLVRAYAAVVHTPRWLVAALTLAALAALGSAGVRRRGFTGWAEAALLEGMALGMLLATAATAGYTLRYLVPAVPLLVAGGTLALSGTWTAPAIRRRRRRPAPTVGARRGGR